jgi:hypothetical protein
MEVESFESELERLGKVKSEYCVMTQHAGYRALLRNK